MEDSSNTLGDSQQERKCSIGLETKNAGIARDEGPIRADDVNERMFPYFVVSLAIRRFSNVLKESRYRNKFSIIKLTCNLFLFLGCGPRLAKRYGMQSKSYLKHIPENLIP